MFQMRPQQNPEEMFSADAAPKAKRIDGSNGTAVPELRRGSTRETTSHEAELKAELAGRKVSHLQNTSTESDRTVFSVQETNGVDASRKGGENTVAFESPPTKSEPERTISTNSAPQQPPPPRPLLITQTSATGLSHLDVLIVQ